MKSTEVQEHSNHASEQIARDAARLRAIVAPLLEDPYHGHSNLSGRGVKEELTRGKLEVSIGDFHVADSRKPEDGNKPLSFWVTRAEHSDQGESDETGYGINVGSDGTCYGGIYKHGLLQRELHGSALANLVEGMTDELEHSWRQEQHATDWMGKTAMAA